MRQEDQVYLIVVGFAHLPKGTPLYEVHKYIASVLKVDTNNHTIVDASFNYLLPLTNEFITTLIKNYKVTDGLEPISKIIEKHYVATEQKALIQSLNACFERYYEHCKKHKITFNH
ncbi:DUF3870 domain-containing protein [Staphylococcus felis]|uniref:DUF3870 domain-containing protein n=1 Tax=Staphylococcus felis TaxID=46127 RepID=UPI003967BE7A